MQTRRPGGTLARRRSPVALRVHSTEGAAKAYVSDPNSFPLSPSLFSRPSRLGSRPIKVLRQDDALTRHKHEIHVLGASRAR